MCVMNRLDMPEGYKNFSKTKPMKLEHFAPALKWWDNREEIEVDGFPKAKKYTVDEIVANGLTFVDSHTKKRKSLTRWI